MYLDSVTVIEYRVRICIEKQSNVQTPLNSNHMYHHKQAISTPR